MKSSTLLLITIVLSILYLSANAFPPKNPKNPNPKTPNPNDQIQQFCGKQTLSDGTQNENGDCVTTIMGQVPNVNSMTSCVITNPANGQNIKKNTAFTVDIAIDKLETGKFSDAKTQYYVFPQQLNAQGIVQGHSHVTIQKLDAAKPPDARVFAFFKGLNDGAKNGVLSVNVEDGLPSTGLYRICTMSSSFTHQPLLMPVAQRGSQDDCIRVNVFS